MTPGRVKFRKLDNGWEAKYTKEGITLYFIKLTGRMNPTGWMLDHCEIDDIMHANLDHWFMEASEYPNAYPHYWENFDG